MNEPLTAICERCQGIGTVDQDDLYGGNLPMVCEECDGLGVVPDRTLPPTFAERFGCLAVLLFGSIFWALIYMAWRSFR